jgi:adenine-specific DNA-methyltransferase
MTKQNQSITELVESLSTQELKRLLVEKLTTQKLGLVWESNSIERDEAMNADVVLPRLREDLSCDPSGTGVYKNLIIEGDNFDSLRLLRTTHANKVRVIYIDPPYNTGNKDWVYNDRYVGEKDRWRHSKWLEFLYQRLMLARDLLAPDGVILVSINDESRAKLELLMDEVFPGRRVGSFVWRSRTGGNDAMGAFFSDNHEHILVYANSGFRFTGDEKSYSIYKHEEGGRVFYLSDLTKAHDYKERPNTYYPIRDPATDIWYPCNPGRVWAYASKARVAHDQKLRGSTIEEMIEENQIWFPPDQKVEVFETERALLEAIDNKAVPFSGSTPLLTRDTPDLKEWVGRRIGYGRPRLKKFKDGLKNESAPISSWLTPRSESDTAQPQSNMPIVGSTDEGSRVLKEIMGDKAFPYPKPLSLIKNVLGQAALPGDFVLDFFAGSGTTGQAVLELNSEDGGDRRFILCSSTEKNEKDPNRNLCRDVCAERMRRLLVGHGDKPPMEVSENNFAYIELDKLDPADARLDATQDQTFQLLTMRNALAAQPMPAGAAKVIAQDQNTAIVYLPEVNAEALRDLHLIPQGKLVVYSSRPQTVAEKLERSGKTGISYSASDAIMVGQTGTRN